MESRHLTSIDDLSVGEIRSLFEHADRFSEDPRAWSHLCRGMISASLFFEPSTRTRLSFESAMLRLGGGVVTAAEMTASSVNKGESLADTVRVVGGGYADAIVLRHPSEGAARLAMDYSPVPVVNAGDGAHEHPTQTLCDLYNLHVERGRIEGLDVVLAGDLKYSRTVHSFAYALARFGANIVCVPQPGFEMPEYVIRRLEDEFHVDHVRADVRKLGSLASESDAMYLTPQKPHQLSLFTDARGWETQRVDALYMTRPQTERHRPDEGASTEYIRLEKRSLSAESLRDAVVMHPLPRRDEISEDVDSDPRSIYFKQAARGVPIRMAILAMLLGRLELGTAATGDADQRRPDPPARLPVHIGGNPCWNSTCISRTEQRHVHPKFQLLSRQPIRAQCGYCSQELQFEWVGCTSTGLYHAPDSAAARQVRQDHVVFLKDEASAEAAGMRAAILPGAGL